MKCKKPLFNSIIGLAVMITLVGCTTHRTIPKEPGPHSSVGDITLDILVDDTTFKRCHAEEYTAQYFNFSNGFRYKGEKIALIELFNTKYKPVEKNNQNGYVRIRFVVNCEGISGQFRVLESDLDYKPFQFHPKITSQLLEITKSLDGWLVVSDETNGPRDYYQYLIFKIKDGRIEELMP
ncbi:MAG: hypothetical protein ACPGVI_00110 [Crocinitomicaceae bacterium]